MSDLVQVTKDGDIAIITINNPPVNALSPGVPEGIAEAIEQIGKDRQRSSRRAHWRRYAHSSPARISRNSAR